MTFDLILLFILIISGIEIFTGTFTSKIYKKEDKNNKKEPRIYTILKLIFIILFLLTTIYFLYKAVYVLGMLLGIPLDKNILDIIRDFTK
ncbi:MAG: hypothetical protein ACTHVE_00185 [Senegalia sp. (in: firmicutes)]|uniref:hypothetical protein n=1 Tax=Senegalia sp. (in: firmicutes) TaxID=1924098 RepID=UPI003F9A3A43